MGSREATILGSEAKDSEKAGPAASVRVATPATTDNDFDVYGNEEKADSA